MTAFRRLLPMLGPPTGRRLVQPGVMLAPFVLARAQAGGARSTALAADGVTRDEFGADVPRFGATAQRLLIEGQRTNAMPNPRLEGWAAGVVGSGGALPTGLTISLPAGLVVTVNGVEREAGIDMLDISVAGTASGTQFLIQFSTSLAIAALPAQVWSGSWFSRLVSAAAPPISHSTRIVPRNGAGSAVDPVSVGFTPTSTLTRFSRSGALTSTAGIVAVTLEYRTTHTVSVAYDWRIRIGLPQMELAPFASSPILPPIGTPGASTRGADLVTASLASLGIGANGAGTYLWSGMIPQAAPSGVDQTLVRLDDGSASNVYRLRNVTGSFDINVTRNTAGVVSASPPLGAMTSGMPFRAGMSISPTGRVAGCLSGGAVQIAAGGPTSGLTTLRLGNDPTIGSAMFGETTHFRIRPPVSDSELIAAVAALPV